MRCAAWRSPSSTAVCLGGVGHGRMPFVDRQLAGHQGRAQPVAVLDDLDQVSAFSTGAGVNKVVEDKRVDPGQLAKGGGVTAVGPAEGEVVAHR